MPNWCCTTYAIEGDVMEVKSLYETMKELQERKEPSVENGFGTTWLGCLVDALGGDWNEVSCRGDWNSLEMIGDTLRFTTETAWAPCNETFDLVCKKFPSLHYYYQTEEPGMAIYATNDSEGKYFPDKYHVELNTPEDEFYSEYFAELSAVFEWLEKISGKEVKSEKEVDELVEQWRKENDQAYCYMNEYKIVE